MMSQQEQQPGTEDFLLRGGSEMAERVRTLDWSKTPLGPLEDWPQSLRTCVSICLNSRFALLIWWGPHLVKIYNDKYVELIGEKHPRALGSPGKAVWPEIWETIGPMLESVLQRGEASWSDDLLLLLERNGYPEECYFTFSYSPILDESGGVGGVFTPVSETTARVVAARREQTLRKIRSITVSRRRNAGDVAERVIRALATNLYDMPFASVYLLEHSEMDGRVGRLAAAAPAGETLQLPEVLSAETAPWFPLDQLASQDLLAVDLNKAGIDRLPTEPWGVPPREAVIVAIRGAHRAELLGFLFCGVNVRKRLDAASRTFYLDTALEAAALFRELRALENLRVLQAEAEAERTKLRDLFLRAPVAIATLSGPEHRFTLANEKYLELIGRKSAAEIVGATVLEVFPELQDQPILPILDSVYRTGTPYVATEMALTLRRGDNDRSAELYLDFVYQPSYDVTGKVDGILVLAVESTAHVLARRELEDAQEQLRVLADSIPQLIWIADPDGSLTWYNRRWYEYSGTTWEQMQGWGWQSLHHPDYLPKVIARYKHSLETGDPFEMTFPLRGADGVFRPFLTLALPVRDSGGNIVRWFGTNTAMEAQYKAEAALRETEKLAVVGRLAASIAHEINNPLEGVTNLIYLARLAADNQETKSYLSAAEKELARVSQITNQTLRFHKQQTAATATDVSELLESILTLYRGKLSREGIVLSVEKRETPVLVCYAGEVRQVLANLIGNALDAMPKGGRLRIRLRPATNWRDGRPGARFTIADTGHGIPKEVRKRIYEPFFTTKGEVGTGLGLWVSAGIVDKGGGSIHVRSCTEPGRSGTVFTLSFPDAPRVAES